jgi:RNA polymerase sigma factor (sigma-70 family)
VNPELLRTLAPQVLAALVRRYGDFDACEDAVQEALLAAYRQWPSSGIPDNPKAWLITTASRRRIEQWRSDTARRRREEEVALAEPPEPPPVPDVDDTLTVLLLCCHPSLPRQSQVALTLRAVGGLTTAEIARAFLVPEPTIGQRISRAKRSLRGARFGPPEPSRLAAVLQVLYLIFTEGHTASSGDELNRVDLTTEAIRLTRRLHASLPEDGEVTGLLALMLLTEARRPARVSPSGALVPLDAQDRALWNAELIEEGTALITGALTSAPVGPYQLQAAIAAVHAEAKTAAETDWKQILTLYDLLRVVAPGPMVTLNRVVALAQVNGPAAGLAELTTAAADPALATHHRVDAVRGHLLELSGDLAGAREAYEAAAGRTLSLPEQEYLRAQAARLSP